MRARADVAIMRDGCDGHNLHGGAHERFSAHGFLEGYQFHAGRFFTGLTVVEIKLHDHREGDGGLCVCVLSPPTYFAFFPTSSVPSVRLLFAPDRARSSEYRARTSQTSAAHSH